MACSTSSEEQAIDSYRNSHDGFNKSLETTSLVRKDILEGRNWQLTGDINGYELPASLKSLLKWIIQGKMLIYVLKKRASRQGCTKHW